MRVVVLFMSLVASISAHNWYKGPYYFVLDVHRPIPRRSLTEISAAIDPNGGTATSSADIGPTLDPDGVSSSARNGELSLSGFAPAFGEQQIAFRGSSIDPAGAQGTEGGDIQFAGPQIEPLGGRGEVSSAVAVVDPNGASAPTVIEPSGIAAVDNANQINFRDNFPTPGSEFDTFPTPGSEFEASPFTDGQIIRRLGSGPDPNGEAGIFSASRSSAADGTAGIAPEPASETATRIREAASTVIDIGTPTGSEIQEAPVGSSSSEIDFQPGSSFSEQSFGEPISAGSEQAYDMRTHGYIGPDHGINTVYRGSYIPSHRGAKWFGGASTFLHYYRNQHRPDFRPHPKFRHLRYYTHGKYLHPKY